MLLTVINNHFKKSRGELSVIIFVIELLLILLKFSFYAVEVRQQKKGLFLGPGENTSETPKYFISLGIRGTFFILHN